MRILKIMLITSILGGLLSAPALSCTSESESTVSESQIVTVQRGDLTIDIAAAGNLALSRTEDLAFEIAVAKEPENGEYLRGLSWAIYSSGDVTKGLAFLEEASRLAPANANILTDLAVAYLSSVNIDKATEYAERAVRLNPTNAVAQDST